MTVSELHAFARSLKRTFGDHIEVELLGGEVKITISGKTAWINELGELTGEASGGRPAGLQIGVNIDRAGVAAARTAVMA